MKPRTGPRRNLDFRMLTVYDDDSGVSRRSSPVARTRTRPTFARPRQARFASSGEASPYADTYAVAVNLVVVENDGSRPGRPDYLRGGEQARRHRAACNRGHGLLRGCVELKVALVRRTSPSIIAREGKPAQISRDHKSEMSLGRARAE